MTKLFLNLDIETTGLNPKEDFILEIAWQVLNEDLTPATEARSYIVDHEADWGDVFGALRTAPEVVRRMHAESGLSAALLSDSENAEVLGDIAEMIRDDLRSATGFLDIGSWTNHLMGFSPQFDASFLQSYKVFQDDLFKEKSYYGLHHRRYDLSSVKIAYEVSGLALPGDWQNTNPHRALSDIEEVRRFALAVKDDLSGIHA